ncbi:acyl-CoA reductase LuxC [Pedobacter psychrotolerans]|uniref:Acyl-CoA reductase n=1 Tax=Pedobacter psychrotolerans TaxID=1843235 RepID=A0A4R2HLV7_9SPHI|nr:acyl-CoA reductase [Pedobacter psychrotolerans]TCO31068.1 acyl-CoA reductase LuxC [Pedobacter psychrotolerans]GGE42415.1 acyl-CoA reductase [Pedobacter psychrotolerans]
MSVLTQEKAIIAFKTLGKKLAHPTDVLGDSIYQVQNSNAWFTLENIEKAILSFSEMLNDADVDQWFETIQFTSSAKKIGLILAGNIPLVGFHDVLCVLATGNIALIKLSSSDDKLIKTIISELIAIEPAFTDKIEYVERLKDFDAVIATGSNNSSRYFDYYFSKVPNIIRKNRNSVAVLDGTESQEDIHNLGADIFDYFGLGCRNVSKLYYPKGYDIAKFYEGIESYQNIINHFKYQNNYDYNKSIYLVNMAKHFDNGFLLLKEDEQLTSPLAVLFYQEYEHLATVENELAAQAENIQCIISKADISLPKFQFGESQHPKLWDYADNVDTVQFLNKLA